MARRPWSWLQPRPGDRVELRVVDASLARALFHGIPAARLLARARLAGPDNRDARPRNALLARLLRERSCAHDRVMRLIARHDQPAQSEGCFHVSEATIALLAWAVATDQDGDCSLVEIAESFGRSSTCDDAVLRACAAYDDRLSSRTSDKRAPAFEACLLLATRAVLGPIPWDRLHTIATQLERAAPGVSLLGDTSESVFPRRLEDEIAGDDRRMAALDRASLDVLMAKDPRELGSAVWRAEQAERGENTHLATFLSDLAPLLAHDGTLVAAIVPLEPMEDDRHAEPQGAPTAASPSLASWSLSTAAALADSLERGAMTLARVRAAVARGGEPALDAVGAEMLRVAPHAMASAAFAEILARSGRPRDVLRLVTYFAIAPDPAPAARALSACNAPELPRVLSAWLEAMSPTDDGGALAAESVGYDGIGSSAERVTVCMASLKAYPRLYQSIVPFLPDVGDAPPPSA